MRKAVTLAIIAAIAGVKTAPGLFQGQPKRSGDTSVASDITVDGGIDPDAVKGVCAAEPKPIEEAKPYVAGPGTHSLLTVLTPKADSEVDEDVNVSTDFADDPRFAYLDVERSQISEVELVACYQVAEERIADGCDYSGGGTTARETLWQNRGSVVVREAKTAKEVRRSEIPWETASCADMIFSDGGTGTQLAYPYSGLIASLSSLSDGTRPDLDVTAQLEMLCEHDVTSVPALADKPLESVTVMFMDEVAGDEGYAPAELGNPVVIETTRAIVPPDQAGSVLCVKRAVFSDGATTAEDAGLIRVTDGRSPTERVYVDGDRPDGTLGVRATGEFSLDSSLALLRT